MHHPPRHQIRIKILVFKGVAVDFLGDALLRILIIMFETTHRSPAHGMWPPHPHPPAVFNIYRMGDSQKSRLLPKTIESGMPYQYHTTLHIITTRHPRSVDLPMDKYQILSLIPNSVFWADFGPILTFEQVSEAILSGNFRVKSSYFGDYPISSDFSTGNSHACGVT